MTICRIGLGIIIFERRFSCVLENDGDEGGVELDIDEELKENIVKMFLKNVEIFPFEQDVKHRD